jgi:hypothetical protein
LLPLERFLPNLSIFGFETFGAVARLIDAERSGVPIIFEHHCGQRDHVAQLKNIRLQSSEGFAPRIVIVRGRCLVR